MLVGPGLGRSDTASAALAEVLGRARAAVVDADALMLLTPAMMPEGKMSPAEYTAFVDSEVKRWGEVVRAANIRVEA